MQIVVVGAGGLLGSAVAAELSAGHDVFRASRRGEIPVDLEDPTTLDGMFAAVPKIDAVVCCAAIGRRRGARSTRPGQRPRS